MKIGQEKTFVPSAFSELTRDGEKKQYLKAFLIKWHSVYFEEGNAVEG